MSVFGKVTVVAPGLSRREGDALLVAFDRDLSSLAMLLGENLDEQASAALLRRELHGTARAAEAVFEVPVDSEDGVLLHVPWHRIAAHRLRLTAPTRGALVDAAATVIVHQQRHHDGDVSARRCCGSVREELRAVVARALGEAEQPDLLDALDDHQLGAAAGAKPDSPQVLGDGERAGQPGVKTLHPKKPSVENLPGVNTCSSQVEDPALAGRVEGPR